MTRLEELTLNLADELLTDEEAREIEASLAESELARQVHIRILEIEAGLRAERQNLELVPSIMERLRDGVADSIAQGVMAQIRAHPTPEQTPDQSSTEGAANEASRVLPFPLPARRIQRSLTHVWLPLAACLLLMAGASAWFFGPTRGEPVLAEVQGAGLSLERAGQLLPVSSGMRLLFGDVLRTTENVKAAISFAPENTRITIQPGTELKLAEQSRGKRFTLRVGKLEASVARQRPFRAMVIVTPQAEARVLGTKFTLLVDTNGTRLEVTEGRVRLTRASDDKAVKVTAGYYAVAAANYDLAALPRTGSILHEYWTNISEPIWEPTWDPKLEAHPAGVEDLALFEAAGNSADNFGERIRGYLHPPKTGDYTFWIAGDGGARFRLSRDDQPRNKVWIASTDGPRKKPREWTKQRKQQSSAITLVAGRKYYIEAVQYDAGKGEHHLAVAWQGPDREREVIPGEFLSPFETKTNEKKGN